MTAEREYEWRSNQKRKQRNERQGNLGTFSFAIALVGGFGTRAVAQESLADAAKRVRANKEQKARQHKTVDVYRGSLNFKAIPKFSDVQEQLITGMEIQVLNSSTLGYRYVLTAKCGEWSKELSGNIESSPNPPYSKEKRIQLDLPSPCSWSAASLEEVREAEGLEGPEPQAPKVPELMMPNSRDALRYKKLLRLLQGFQFLSCRPA